MALTSFKKLESKLKWRLIKASLKGFIKDAWYEFTHIDEWDTWEEGGQAAFSAIIILYFVSIILYPVVAMGLENITFRECLKNIWWFWIFCPWTLFLIIRSIWAAILVKKDIQIFPDAASLTPNKVIPDHINELANNLKSEIIGEGSQFKKIYNAVKDFDTQAQKAQEDIETYMKSGKANFLAPTKIKAQEIAYRSSSVLNQLIDFQKRIESFVNRLAQSTKSLQPRLEALELVRRVDRLSMQADEAEHAAEQTILESFEKIRSCGENLQQKAVEQLNEINIRPLLVGFTNPLEELQKVSSGISAISIDSDLDNLDNWDDLDSRESKKMHLVSR